MRKVWILGFLTAAVLSAQPATVAAGHVRFGATLPATCKTTTGDVFFLTSGTTGVYSCTSTNTWTQPGGSGSGATIPSVTNLISGDGAGNGADSGIVPANVEQSSSNIGSLTIIKSGGGRAAVGSGIGESGGALFATAGNSGNLTYGAGQDTNANNKLGSATVRGGNVNGSGGAASSGGDVVVTGGSNVATNAASQGGNVAIIPGPSTGATQGLQGWLEIFHYYVKGATVTQWNGQCESASATVTDCGASPANGVIGVAQTVNTNTVLVKVAPSQSPINASAAVTLGHTVCWGSTAGQVTDSGGTAPCTNSQGAQAGIVMQVAGTKTLTDGTTVALSTTLPLVAMISAPAAPALTKFASDISALAFASCDGTTDDTAGFTTMSALAVNIRIPAGLTCVINAPTIVSNTHIIGGPNSRLLKLAGSTTTYLITTSSKTDILFQNLILDGNSVVQTTSNLYSVFISAGSDVTFDKVTFQNSGSPSNTMGGLDVFNASVVVRNSTFASTTQANQFTANINNNIANRVQVLNNTFNSSQAKAVWIQNSGSEGICNAEVAGNYINNVTDAAGDAGQTGNAISIFQCDYAQVHDNQIKTVRYAGIRVATSSWTDVHDNIINGAQETAIYCSELGGGNNHCHHNTILNSASGINMTNVSSRSPDARNVADYNTCINVSYYCVYAEHDIATNNTADGVPFAFIAGHGSTSHDNIMIGNNCTQSSASYAPVDVCVGVDTGMTGTSIIANNPTNGTTAPTISAQAATNTPSNLVITGITKAASAVVTTSSTLPASGSTICFVQIAGMVEINGLCGAVSSPSGSTFTVAINSTGFTTFTATSAGGTAPVGNGIVVYSSGTTPANAYAANFTGGDATTVNGLAVPASATFVTTNSSRQFVAADMPEIFMQVFGWCYQGSATTNTNTASSNFTHACYGASVARASYEAIPSTGGSLNFSYELAKDWDTTNQPFIAIEYGSGTNTTGTVIWTVSTACSKQDGSVSDDPAMVAETAMASQTMAVAHRGWVQSMQLTTLTSGNNCIAGSPVNIKLAVSGTASANIDAFKAVITQPRKPVVQAN